MFGKDKEPKKGMMEMSLESWLTAFEQHYMMATIKADPYQKTMMAAEVIRIKQNEEILAELKKLNAKE